MNNKKTVLLLMNGFGIETAKSFSIYSKSLMPNLDSLTNEYPFGSIYASGVEANLEKKQLSDFTTGFSTFSTSGKLNRKEDIIKNKMGTPEFDNSPILDECIGYTKKYNSRLHIILYIGDKTTDEMYRQLKYFCGLCVKKGIQEIFLHLFLGNNSNRGMQVSLSAVKMLSYHVLSSLPQVKIAVICGSKYINESANIDEEKNYYRMVVSGVGEIWANYEETIQKKYNNKETDDNLSPFLVRRENVIRSNDSIVVFNYDNDIAKTYLDIVTNSTKYFPVGKAPNNIKVGSLFNLTGSSTIRSAFNDELSEEYFLSHIPDDKKILIISSKQRMNYISNCLNGFRPTFRPNIGVIPLELIGNRFDLITKYLTAYMNQNVYDLIIVDYEIYNEAIDNPTVDSLKNNLKSFDNNLKVVVDKTLEMDQDLVISSLYGVKTKLTLVAGSRVDADFSIKTPLINVGNDIKKSSFKFKPDGAISYLANLIYYKLGLIDNTQLIQIRKKKNGTRNLIIIFVVVLLGLLGFYFYAMYL